MEEKKLSVLKLRLLEAILAGVKSPKDLARALNLPKPDVVKELTELAGMGYVKQGGLAVFKSYAITTEGTNVLGAPKLELDAIRESTIIKSGVYSRLTITVRNTGSAPARNGAVRVIFPKQMNVIRVGAAYASEPEHFVLTLPLRELNAFEAQSMIFDLVGALPGGIMSTKYKLTIQALLGETLTDKKEISIYVETQERYGAIAGA